MPKDQMIEEEEREESVLVDIEITTFSDWTNVEIDPDQGLDGKGEPKGREGF